MIFFMNAPSVCQVIFLFLSPHLFIISCCSFHSTIKSQI